MIRDAFSLVAENGHPASLVSNPVRRRVRLVYSRQARSLEDTGDITLLLRQWSGGDTSTLAPLFQLVYPQLKRMAGALFRGERPDSLLQPTVLVNELYLKLLRENSLQIQDRQHFFSLAARLMRHVLVDQARQEARLKRNGREVLRLDRELSFVDKASPEMFDLDKALNELDEIDPRKCRMVEMRFFLGFTAEETAE